MKKINPVSPNYVMIPRIAYDCMVWKIEHLELKIEALRKGIPFEINGHIEEISKRNIKKYYSKIFKRGIDSILRTEESAYLMIPCALISRMGTTIEDLEYGLEVFTS